jgi:uncharacterized membrane protein
LSQNRQTAIVRADAKDDYEVNVKAELEIELLHQKIDMMRESEIVELTRWYARWKNASPPRRRARGDGLKQGQGSAPMAHWDPLRDSFP